MSLYFYACVNHLIQILKILNMKKCSKINKRSKSFDKNLNVINLSDNYKTAGIYDVKRRRDNLIEKEFNPTYNNRAGIFKHSPPAIRE